VFFFYEVSVRLRLEGLPLGFRMAQVKSFLCSCTCTPVTNYWH